MSMNLVTLLYLVASVCFIQALKGLSHPTTSIRGNLFGMIGMAIAALTTAALIVQLSGGKAQGMAWVLLGLRGRRRLRRLPRQDGRDDQDARAGGVLPQHDRPGCGVHCDRCGCRALGISASSRRPPTALYPRSRRATGLSLRSGAAIGAITFSGSVIAFGKLSGKYKFRLFQGAPVSFRRAAQAQFGAGSDCFWPSVLMFTFTGNPLYFAIAIALAFVMGVLIIIPIGGADMPVVVSMLNSYSGWAAAGIGFSLNNSMLIIAGSLVGSSAARSCATSCARR